MAQPTWDESVILDIAHLSGFTGGDPDFENQVLNIFLDNAPGYLISLSETDTENWKAAAHKLKGAARSIGAWRLACAAERAEKMRAPDQGDNTRAPIIATLQTRMSQLVDFIKIRQRDVLHKSF